MSEHSAAKEKVLFLSYWFPNKHAGNQALFVKRHAQAAALCADIKILAINVSRSRRLFNYYTEILTDEAGVETHLLYFETRFNKLFYLLLPVHFIFIKRYIEKKIAPGFKFGLIHSNVLFPCAIIGSRLASHYKVKHVITEHWSKVDKFFRVSAYKKEGKKALDTAFAVTCVSHQLLNTVSAYTSNKAIHVVPNVVDTRNYQFNPQTMKNAVFTFIAVAHWHAPKNPFYFLDALQQLNQEKKIVGFKVVLIGEGSQIEIIKSRNYAFQIGYLGNLPANRICEELNKSHVFVHGSDYETFSVVIAEALTCGLPCVVSPVGIAPELINSSNGRIAGNSVEDWKHQLLDCYSQKYDHETIAGSMSGKYSQERVAELFNAIYKGAY